MDILWRIIFSLSIFSLILALHKWIGKYSKPLNKSINPGKEIKEVLLLWIIAVIVPIIRMFILTPWFNEFISQRFFLELAYVPMIAIAYIIIPVYIVMIRGKWKSIDVGLTWKVNSLSVAIFAITLGVMSGLIAYISNQAVIGSDPLSAGTLLLLLFNNDFIEEFIHRGIIQSKLERVFGQRRAIIFGGVLFGLTHIAFDFSMLLDTGIIFVFFAFLLQTMLGWLLGIIYMKTRSLWPGVACHFFVNWLPSILVGILG
jgi:membrane protease YdiL (CAAX protease family)